MSSNEKTIAIHGDSTAIASRIPYSEKIWNTVPLRDPTRWFNKLGRKIHNDGVAGQSILELRDKMLADTEHRANTTIIYDRMNDGETPAMYVDALEKSVATLQTKCVLILPQIPNHRERLDVDSRFVMPLIDAEVRRRFPANTLNEQEQRSLVRELSDPATRADDIHRNAAGQAIEARHIAAWLKRTGC